MATPEQERFLAQYRFQGPGKRVKPRVRSLMALVGLGQFLVFTGTLALGLFCVHALHGVGNDLKKNGPSLLVVLLFYTSPIVTMTITRLLMIRLLLRFKLLSPEEGRDLKWYSDKHFPPSCWEPHDDLQTTPESLEKGETHERS
jgi:hypothetical protein